MAKESKSLSLQILSILRKHADVNHRLAKSDIIERLDKNYDQPGANGITINANIETLNEYLDDAIEYEKLYNNLEKIEDVSEIYTNVEK